MKIRILGLSFLCSILFPVSVGASAGRQDPIRSRNAAADATSIKEYAGRYQVDPKVAENYIFDVTIENDELWLKPSHIDKKKLIRQSGDSFLVADVDVPVKFIRDATGKVTSFNVHAPMLFEGQSVTATKLALAGPSLKGNTTFKLKGYPEARLVAVAGTFNNWNQSQYFFARQGDEWICRIDLAPGKYQYKFIHDGDWITDPTNPRAEDDGNGNTNSVLAIKP